MSPKQPRIAIVGGGPGGLTLAALLHKRGIPFTIYELRPRPTEAELAEPSGMLDLHEESGINALRACGLYERFHLLTGDCEESMIVSDRHGNILHSDMGDADGASRPEIARLYIVNLILSVLPEESIKFNTKLTSATRDPATGEVTLDLRSTLEHGTTTSETYDLVVGADGAWSRIRPLLSPSKPQNSNIYYMVMHIKNITTRYPHLVTLIGKGSFFALGNRNGFDSHRAPQDSSRLCVFLHATGEEEEANGDNGNGNGNSAIEALSDLPIQQLKDRVLGDDRMFGGWSPTLKGLLATGFDEELKSGREKLRVRPLATLPVGHRWDHTPGVTLIGDAGNLMLPSGEGVNLAMWDALDLSGAIAEAWGKTQERQQRQRQQQQSEGEGEGDSGTARDYFRAALSAPVREFEDFMFARGEVKAEEARQINEMMYDNEDGAQKLAAMMRSFYEMLPQ